MNIAVVFTGGTIGSKADGGVIAPGMPNRKLLSVCPKYVKADIYEPYTSLSEYLTGEHINKLVLQIKELLKKNYDGIIITHGTDTMRPLVETCSLILCSHRYSPLRYSEIKVVGSRTV